MNGKIIKRLFFSLFLCVLGDHSMSSTTQSSSALYLEVLSTIKGSYQEGATLVKYAKDLAQLSSQLPPNFRAPVQYHYARVLASNGQVDAAVKLLQELAQKDNPYPEVIWLLIQLKGHDIDAESSALRWQYEKRLGKMLPLSIWGKLNDQRLEEQRQSGLIQTTSRPDYIPNINSQSLLSIAKLYKQMHFANESALGYRHYIYQSFYPPEFPVINPDSWFGKQTAEYWHTIYQLETAQGKTASAWQALVNTVVSDPEYIPDIQISLDDLHNPNSLKHQAKPNEKALWQIVQLYRVSNLHPLALTVLQKNREHMQVGSELSTEIKEEWVKLVSYYLSENEGVCYLFGQKVTTENAIDITPW